MTAHRSICFTDPGGGWMRVPSGLVSEVLAKTPSLADRLNAGAVPSKLTVDFVYLEADDAYPIFLKAATALGQKIVIHQHIHDPHRSAVRSMADWNHDLHKTGFLGAELKLSTGEVGEVVDFNRPIGHGLELVVKGRDSGNTYWIPTSEALAFAEAIRVPEHVLAAAGIDPRPPAAEIGIDLSHLGTGAPKTPSLGM